MMRRALILFLSLVFTCSVSFAASIPVSKMQNAVSGVTQAKMQGRGFAANDPRFANTLVSIGGTVGYELGSLATVTLLGVTAPAWASIAVGLAAAGAVAFAIDEGLKWIVKTDDTVQVGDNPASPNTPAGLAPPTIIYCAYNVCAPTPQAVCAGQPPVRANYNNQPGTYFHEFESDGHCHLRYKFDSLSTVPDLGPDADAVKSTANTTLCPGISLTASAGKCPASNFPEPAQAPVKTLSDAVNALSDQQKAKPLSPQIVADLANELWKEAASSPGYDGLPYDATNPLTATDAAAWQATNPNSWPSVGDFVAPQPAPNGGTAGSPFTLPTSPTPVQTQDPTSQPQTGTNPSTEPLENLGTDPGIGAPALEPIPTAQQILQPLLNLFPTLRNFVVPNHNAVCPKWSVHLFDRDVQLQDHCAMLEQARPTAQATMAAVWILIALFIVLAA